MCFFGVDLAALAMLWPRGWEFTASLHTPATILPLQRRLRAPLRSAQCSRTEPETVSPWVGPRPRPSGTRAGRRRPRASASTDGPVAVATSEALGITASRSSSRLSLPRTQARRRKDGARPNDHAGPPRQGAARRGCTPMLPCDGVRHCLGCERPRRFGEAGAKLEIDGKVQRFVGPSSRLAVVARVGLLVFPVPLMRAAVAGALGE